MPTDQLRSDAQRRVEEILAAAKVMLAEDPTVSPAQIAERANVHRTTLRRHFPTREALVQRLLEQSLDAIEARLVAAELDDDDALEAIRHATLVWIDVAKEWRAGRYGPLSALRSSGTSARLRERMAGLVARGQQEGAIRTDVSVQTLVYAWAGLIMSYNALLIDSPPEHLADEIVRLLSP